MTKFFQTFRRRIPGSSTGASTVEYGILVALISVVAIGSVASYEGEVSRLFSETQASLSALDDRGGEASGSSPSEEEAAPPALELTFVGTTITLDVIGGNTDGQITWEDGATAVVPAYMGADYTHTFSSSGPHSVEITGGVQEIRYGPGVTEIVTWGRLPLQSFYIAFQNASDLTTLPTWMPSGIVDMNDAFRGLDHTITGPESWDTSGVEEMRGTFRDATVIPDISGWEINAIAISSMFRDSTFNQDISGWDVSTVGPYGMRSVFAGAASFNQDLSSWCVPLIETEHESFDAGATAWTLPDSRPAWGSAC